MKFILHILVESDFKTSNDISFNGKTNNYFKCNCVERMETLRGK